MNDPYLRPGGPYDGASPYPPRDYPAGRPPRRGPLPLAGLGLLMALVAVAAFGLGAVLDRVGWLPGASPRPPRGLGKTFDPFWEAWGLVEEHYVDRDAVKPQEMTRGAIRGMLDALGDTGHTTYLSPEEVKRFESDLKGDLEGIGAGVSLRNHMPTITHTLPDSPARQAGLRPGDVIVSVDGEDVAELPLDRVVEKVRGKAGTTVHLRIGRTGEAKPLEFDIKRAKVQLDEVTWHMLPGTPAVAHVAVREFAETTDKQLRLALKAAKNKGAKGLVVDVRGNPGGLKDQAVSVTSEFIGDGAVFVEQDAKGKRTDVPVEKGGVATEIPMVLLIDEGTASAAEIFAGAVQDHERGKLVGAKTFGTGTVLEPFDLSDGGQVLLATSEWLTPKGRKIWHEGIAPDVEVALPADAAVLAPEEEDDLTADGLAKSTDKQLLKALEVLKERLK